MTAADLFVLRTFLFLYGELHGDGLARSGSSGQLFQNVRIHRNRDRVLEIEVPYSFTGKKDVTVYRKHGSEEPKVLTRRAAKPAADVMTDGSFFADSRNGKIYIYASKFSTYAIGYTQSSGETVPS